MEPRGSVIPETDGLMLARIPEGGVWEALCALRDGMRGMADRTPQASFVAAITGDGRLVPGQHPEARLLVLGYRSG